MIPNQVQFAGVPRRVRHLKVTERSVCLPPMLRLEGQWLVDAGFKPGQRVEVTNIEQERIAAVNRLDAVMQATAPARAEVAA